MGWLSIARYVVQELGARSSDEDDDYFFDEPEEVANPEALTAPPTAGSWLSRGHDSARGVAGLHVDDGDRVYTAFDASQPVEHPADLRGREAGLASLLAGVMFRRNHGVVAGRRGSGKTSLVRSFGQCADRDGVVVLYSACDNGTNFGDLMQEYLRQIPASSLNPEDVAEFGERVRTLRPDATPNQVTSLFSYVKYSQAIIICDEFDQVTQADLQLKISSLMKLLSDARLPIRFLLAGDRSAFGNIVRGHSSLSRHVTLVKTDPLDSQAMNDLLNDCAARCSLTFTTQGLRIIKNVACGSPYHARLFGLHAGLRALGGRDRSIGRAEVLGGLGSAFEEWALMNQSASDACLAIASGAHGDPASYVEIARSVVEGSGDVGEDAPLSLTPAQQIALAPALEPGKGAICFRDPVAPQFLIAICEVIAANSPFVQKGLTHA